MSSAAEQASGAEQPAVLAVQVQTPSALRWARMQAGRLGMLPGELLEARLGPASQAKRLPWGPAGAGGSQLHSTRIRLRCSARKHVCNCHRLMRTDARVQLATESNAAALLASHSVHLGRFGKGCSVSQATTTAQSDVRRRRLTQWHASRLHGCRLWYEAQSCIDSGSLCRAPQGAHEPTGCLTEGYVAASGENRPTETAVHVRPRLAICVQDHAALPCCSDSSCSSYAAAGMLA